MGAFEFGKFAAGTKAIVNAIVEIEVSLYYVQMWFNYDQLSLLFGLKYIRQLFMFLKP